jgi:hypothetical protein
MAVTVSERVIDDYTLTEVNDGRQLLLVVNSRRYLVDLSPASYVAFRKAIQPFIRNVGVARVPARIVTELIGLRETRRPGNTKRLRSWWEARWQALGLPEPGPHGKGRIPEEVALAYVRGEQ